MARKRERERAGVWVVYRANHSKTPGGNAVCEQAEWDELLRGRPGEHTLIRAGIASEAEAEALARSAPGGTAPKAPKLKAH